MKCPKCGTKVERKDKFCPNCDFKIRGGMKFRKEYTALIIVSILLIIFFILSISLNNKNTELNNKNTELSNKVIKLENEITKLNKREERLNQEMKEKEETIKQLEDKVKQLTEQKTTIKYQCSDGTIKSKLEDCSKSIETVTQQTTMSETELWNVFCDVDATELQKQRTFDKYKDSYITTTGEIRVIHTDGEVYLRHCDSTWTWNIQVKMQSSQIDKLLSYKEGDKLTYKARLTTFTPNAILSSELKADNGIVGS